ncbi:MAG: Rid family detoxifying hydrolase [Chloroflexi bacterium]|nr:Rid family detoxifying hydrolase [Chloroflexota bacterium]
MKREIIRTDKAPVSRSPISQATRFGQLVFTAGQGPLDPESGDLISGDMRAMVRQTLDNIKAILEAAGTSMDNVLKVTCYLRDMADFPVWNEVYREYFRGDPPARVTVQVVLGGGLPIEVDAVACIPDEC